MPALNLVRAIRILRAKQPTPDRALSVAATSNFPESGVDSSDGRKQEAYEESIEEEAKWEHLINEMSRLRRENELDEFNDEEWQEEWGDLVEREENSPIQAQEEKEEEEEEVEGKAQVNSDITDDDANEGTLEEEDEDFNIDDIIGDEVVEEEGEMGELPEDIDPSLTEELHDNLGGLRKEDWMEEPERAFNYPELPEREITFRQLLEKCGYDEDVVEQYSDVGDIKITGIATDSRRVMPGNLFICIEGSHADGHHFIPHAITEGANLIIARLMVPGAELALYTDADPTKPELADLYQEPYYKMAENDTLTMEACSDEMAKVYDKMQGFGEKNGLNEEEIEKIQMAGAMRCISSALNYDFSHWEKPEMKSPADEEMTPHPLNPLIPVEINTPVTFAIDPQDFAATLAHGFYDRPSHRMTTVGITGTNGKTTVAWLMRSVFEQLGRLTGLIGTIEYAVATDRLDLDGEFWEDPDEDPTLSRECSAPFWAAPYQGKYSVPCTTPDNVSVQRIMAGMADRGATACVLECTSIGLEQGRVELVDLDVAIFTNLSRDHLDYHDDMEEYTNAKAYMFEGLHDPERQRAIINYDDAAAETMATAAKNVPVVTYSFSQAVADVYTKNVKFSIWETEMTIQTPLGVLEIVTPLIGRPNVYNILACVAASISINIELSVVVAALENAEIVPGRYELIDEGQEFVCMVDYAHTPDALNTLLDTVRECADCKRIILVFGCGGDRDSGKRAYMGEIAHYKADVVILTNDNPRTEPPEDIIDDIVDGFPEEVTNAFETSTYNYMVDVGRVPPIFEQELLERQGEVKRYVIEDRWSAIRAAIAIAQKNDVVIIAGKGHEDYIEYGDADGGLYKAWFDDRVEARNALTRLPALDRIPYLNRKNLPFTRK